VCTPIHSGAWSPTAVYRLWSPAATACNSPVTRNAVARAEDHEHARGM
jgi:hypothetical protein